jgi:AraC-like DNA-binding protein
MASSSVSLELCPVVPENLPTTVTRSAGIIKDARELLGPRLNKLWLRAFQQLTGLRLHILWHDPLENLRGSEMGVLCPTAIRRFQSIINMPAKCQDCLKRRWDPKAHPDGHDRPFKGPCGAISFWTHLRVREAGVLTLVLQGSVGRRLAASRGTIVSQLAPWLRSNAANGRTVSSQSPFSRAVALLKMMFHDLETTIQCSFIRRELETARLRLRNLEAEDARLQRELRLRAPRIPERRVSGGSGSHREQIVQRMLDYVHTHYQHPLQLGDIARALEMNACYLSTLFSHTLGVTFHHYLDELRLTAAKELLRDPVRRVREVAYAVGYASAGSFRSVFRSRTGIAPSAWRGEHMTLRTTRTGSRSRKL